MKILFKLQVSVFRNVEDFKNLRQALESGAKSVAIVGGGLLGSEIACSLSKFGELSSNHVTDE